MLRLRLTLGLLPLVALLIAVGVYGLQVVHRLALTLERDVRQHYEALAALAPLRDEADELAEAAMAAAREPYTQRDRIEAARREFEADFRRLYNAAASAGRRTELEVVDDAFLDLLNWARSLDEGQVASALLREREAAARHLRITSALDALRARTIDDVQAIEAGVRRQSRLATGLLTSAMAAAVLLAGLIAWWLARALIDPIRTVSSAAVAIGEGDLERTVPVLSEDELGQLARRFNDMTARLRAYRDAMREEVQRAQRTTEATLTASPDPVYVFGPDLRIDLRNPAATALGGIERLPEPLLEAVRKVVTTGRHDVPMSYDRVVTLTSGPGAREPRHFLPRILAVTDSMTGLTGAAMILQDVTKFRLLDDAKTNLVGTVSHELKSPLTSLRMALYLLLEPHTGELAAIQRELVETARDDADRLLRILDDLLDLARLESGVTELRLQPVPVRGLLEEMAREIRPHLDARGQHLAIELTPGVDTIEADRDRLRHVFINLLGNASKYAPEQGTITLYAAPADGDFVRFGVRDAGPGIPPEAAAHIFDRFYRVPGQTKKGAGLGLAISREIVVAHGGSIRCASTPGQGSDFFFFIPRRALRRAAADAGGEAAADQPPAAPALEA